MGNCNCKNSDIKQEVSFQGQNNISQTITKAPVKQEKYFKLRKPKVSLDIIANKNEEKSNNNTNSNKVVNISNGNKTKNSNCNSNNKSSINQINNNSDAITKYNYSRNDLESIDEKVIIHNSNDKNNYIDSLSISQDKPNTQTNKLTNLNKNSNTQTPQYSIDSQVATYNFDKKETSMFNNEVNKFHQEEEALDPLTKAFSMSMGNKSNDNFNCLKYEEAMIDQRESFTLIDSIGGQKNFKDIFEETSSRETYSYLHSEIKKSSCLFSIIIKKRLQELRYQFAIWKGKNENKIKDKIIKSLALIKLKTVFCLYYRKHYYSLLIERLKLYKQSNSRNSLTTKAKEKQGIASHNFMNQMISFLNMTSRMDKMLLKRIFKLFVYKSMSKQSTHSTNR